MISDLLDEKKIIRSEQQANLGEASNWKIEKIWGLKKHRNVQFQFWNFENRGGLSIFQKFPNLNYLKV